jgi:hypothetical protein
MLPESESVFKKRENRNSMEKEKKSTTGNKMAWFSSSSSRTLPRGSLGGKLHLLEKKDDVMRNYLL